MRAEGLEPSSSLEHRHLKPACLPSLHRARGLVIVPLRWSTNLSAVLLSGLSMGGERCCKCDLLEEFNDVQRLTAAGMKRIFRNCEADGPRRTVAQTAAPGAFESPSMRSSRQSSTGVGRR